MRPPSDIVGPSNLGRTDVEKVTTTQLTSKPLKLQMALSATLFFVAMFAAFLTGGAPIAIAGTLVGFVWHIVARLLIWWHHD